MFTVLDYTIFLLSSIIIIFSAYNGFLKEFNYIFNIIVAMMISYFAGNYVKHYLDNFIPIKLFSFLIAYGMIFIIALLWLNQLLGKLFARFQFSRSSDIILGAVLGIIKSIASIYLVFIIIEMGLPISAQPNFIKNSYIKHIFDNSALIR
ncbi:Colicin V production protein [Candidatus Hepatincolaceae symbiont of Richtersius coronifer]